MKGLAIALIVIGIVMMVFRSINFTEEKKAFAEFLQQTGIDPRQIQFDPNYQTHLEVKFSQQGLHFKGGWMDDAISSSK